MSSMKSLLPSSWYSYLTPPDNHAGTRPLRRYLEDFNLDAIQLAESPNVSRDSVFFRRSFATRRFGLYIDFSPGATPADNAVRQIGTRKQWCAIYETSVEYHWLRLENSQCLRRSIQIIQTIQTHRLPPVYSKPYGKREHHARLMAGAYAISSVSLAWLGPEAMALAWLRLAQACKILGQGQSQEKPGPGQSQWLEPWLGFKFSQGITFCFWHVMSGI
jgi:hypothetical protein